MSEDDSKKFTWGAVAAVQPVSFADLMSEELADHLNQQELRQGVLNKVLSAWLYRKLVIFYVFTLECL